MTGAFYLRQEELDVLTPAIHALGGATRHLSSGDLELNGRVTLTRADGSVLGAFVADERGWTFDLVARPASAPLPAAVDGESR